MRDEDCSRQRLGRGITNRSDQRVQRTYKSRGNEAVTDFGVEALVTACTMLSELNISGCKLITDYSVSKTALNCPYLRNLDISWCNITDDSVGL